MDKKKVGIMSARKHRIKTVKEYIKNGPSQFVVLARMKPGVSVTVSVSSTTNPEESWSETLIPAEEEGFAKIVQRLSDDKIFHYKDCVDLIETKGLFRYMIAGFLEDNINCLVLDTFCSLNKADAKKIIPINQINSSRELYEDEQDRAESC